MFDWFRRRRGDASDTPQQPGTSQQLPAEARRYTSAIQPYLNHAFVRVHFHQVTCLALVAPGGAQTDFYCLEFRAGTRAALIWNDDLDHWQVGQYVPLSHPGADITCPPSGLAESYFENCTSCLSLQNAIAFLEAATPMPFRGVDPKTFQTPRSSR